jgi:hypothetical protein
MSSNPRLVASIRNMRFMRPEVTDMGLAMVFGVSVPTIRKYVDDISTSRRHVCRMVAMRSGATYRVA